MSCCSDFLGAALTCSRRKRVKEHSILTAEILFILMVSLKYACALVVSSKVGGLPAIKQG